MSVQEVHWSPSEWAIPSSLRGLVVGASQIGKSSLVLRCLQQHLFGSYAHIYFVYPSIVDCHSDKEKLFVQQLQAIPNLTVLESLPESCEEVLSLIIDPNDKYLLIADDSTNVFASATMDEVYKRLSNHLNLSVLSIVQSGFHGKTPFYQSIFRSLNFLILFRPIADQHALALLGNKIFGPGGAAFLTDAMRQAQEWMGNRAYLVLDLSSDKVSNIHYPIRTLLLPTDGIDWPLPIVFKRSPKSRK